MRSSAPPPRGQNMVELILLVALVALALVVAVSAYHKAIRDSYHDQQEIVASPL